MNLPMSRTMSIKMECCRWVRGETVVTQTHTYTEWFSDQTGEVTARMLYDLSEDPEETVNISEKKKYKNLVQEL